MNNNHQNYMVNCATGSASATDMRSRLSGYDWKTSELGVPGNWPAPLKTAVSMILDSPLPMWVCWGPTLLLIYNDGYAQILGTKHPHALMQHYPEVWSEVWESLNSVVADAMTGKSTFSENVGTSLLRDGQLQAAWFTFSVSPLRDEQGGIAGIYGTAIETTVQTIAFQQQSAETETGHQRAFQLELADLIRPISDADEVIVSASRLLGERLNSARVIYATVNQSSETITMRPDWTNGNLPSMAGTMLRLEDFGPLIADAVRAGHILAIADVSTDERCSPYAAAYADKGVRSFVGIPLMKTGRLQAILSIHDSQPHHWSEHEIALARDMVDRTWSAVDSADAQAKLRYERDQSKYIFDNMTEGFGLVDSDWKILHINAEGLRITQRLAHEVIGRNHWEVWPELTNTAIGDLYERVKKTHLSETVELPFTFPNGRNGWAEIRVYPSLDNGLAFFFRDISAAKASQKSLEDADRRKDDFLAMLAHELRNPLAPISAAAQLLQIGKLDELRVRKTSQIIKRQADHMTHLIDDLLDVSRVTRGLVELDKAIIDIRQIVSDAVEQVATLIQAKRHRLTLQLSPDAVIVRGDKKRLVQVIANLVNNAAKYTSEGGNILIRTDVRGPHVAIEVLDDGIGMTADLAAHAFDLFAQAERTSDRSSGGLGLGLALVKSLVELHEGTVTCRSEGIDQGSQFIVLLPKIMALDYRDDDQSLSSSAKFIKRPLRITLVDDNVDAAAMLAILLGTAGHQVQIEHEPWLALERSLANPSEVFLLDIGLPGMDGNELARRLRSQPETEKSVLIAVTGYGQEGDRDRTRHAGFDHHLVKPIDTDELALILASIS